MTDMTDLAAPSAVTAPDPTAPQRVDLIRDLVAFVLLMAGLALPVWHVPSMQDTWAEAGWMRPELVAATMFSLLALGAPYAAKADMFPTGWSETLTRMVRLAGNVPYVLVAVTVLVGLTGATPERGLAVGLAGAVLAAQPHDVMDAAARRLWDRVQTGAVVTAGVAAVVELVVTVVGGSTLADLAHPSFTLGRLPLALAVVAVPAVLLWLPWARRDAAGARAWMWLGAGVVVWSLVIGTGGAAARDTFGASAALLLLPALGAAALPAVLTMDWSTRWSDVARTELDLIVIVTVDIVVVRYLTGALLPQVILVIGALVVAAVLVARVQLARVPDDRTAPVSAMLVVLALGVVAAVIPPVLDEGIASPVTVALAWVALPAGLLVSLIRPQLLTEVFGPKA
jgi:hypothetical protein